MRILFLSAWYPYPPTNGSELRAYYLLRGLAERHEVTALALRPVQKTGIATLPPLAGVDLRPAAADPFRYVGQPAWVRYASPQPLSMWPIAELRRALRDPGIADVPWDAVIAFQGPVARYVTMAEVRARVVDIDTSLSYQMLERYESAPGPAERVRTWVSWRKAAAAERRVLRSVDVATAVSTHELGYLRRIAPSTCRLEHSPNGVDCEHHRPGLASPRPGSLVYNGAMTYSANYDAMQFFLRDVYPLVRAQVPGASLTITGSTAGVDLAGLALDGSVRLSGYVDDIRSVIAGSAACVVPLRHGGGTRLKILEAMALGVPVVSTRKGAEGLDVDDGEHLLLADGPRDLAAATVRLLQDSALRARLASSARALVEQRYDWRAIGAAFAALVEDSVARKRGDTP
ncbi:MAG: glycosyltransferase family 4 protein [Anaerolineae bacterium]